MNCLFLLLASLVLTPCETEQQAIDVATWECPREDSRWVRPIACEWKGAVGKFSFTRPWRWYLRRTMLKIDGAVKPFNIRINGKPIADVTAATTCSAVYDVSKSLKWFGRNEIVVSVGVGTASSADFNDIYLVSEHPKMPQDVVAETWLADDCSSGRVTIRAGNGQILKERTVDRPRLWSDELPNLYMTPLEFKFGFWPFNSTEFAAVKFAFRRVEVKEGVLMLNGRPMRLNGAVKFARPWTNEGRFPNLSGMVRDIRALKVNYLTGVRAADCPQSQDWFDLCARDGIYVLATPNDRAPRDCPAVLEIPADVPLPAFTFAMDGSRESIRRAAVVNRPIRVESLDWATGVAKVRNHFRFLDFSALDAITWKAFDAKGDEIAKGQIPKFALAPGSSGTMALEGLKGDKVAISFLRDYDVVSEETVVRGGK